MALAPSCDLSGDFALSDAAPPVRWVRDALVVPQQGDIAADRAWGVYDADGVLVEEAAYIRGPGRMLVGQSEMSSGVDPVHKFDGEYVYGGSAHGHYGHYLLSFLSRYWLGQADAVRGRKILIHQTPGADGWLGIPFVAQTLRALDLDASCFVAIETPARVECLIVPAPSLVEQKVVHAVFGDMCRWIGQVLSRERPQPASSQPIFLSKGRLQAGVWRIDNEQAFLDELEAAGIRIVYPEEMDLPAQIAFFDAHQTIAGIMGSALHTTAFCAEPKRVIGIGHSNFVSSNFALIDAVKGNDASYWHPVGGLIHNGPSPLFQGTFSFADPKAAGAAFARLLVG